MALVILAGLGLVVVLVTRYVLYRGIDMLTRTLGWSAKTRGQILGYSTSMPEFAGTVFTAAAGLLDAGLWNIASSNIINVGLFLAANLFYRQYRDLTKIKFVDEIGFALGAVAVPLVLSVWGVAGKSVWTALGLALFFAVYIIVDWMSGQSGHGAKETDEPPENGSDGNGSSRNLVPHRGLVLARSIGLLLVGILGIVVLGRLLGIYAGKVVAEMGVSQIGVGWVLGVVTSLPEMTSFFAIYAYAKKTKTLDKDLDTQEALDNLTASNMSNLGLIYPLGILVFLLFGT